MQAGGEVEVIGMVKGGAAERSGTLQVGDLLLSIDGIKLHGMAQTAILDLVMGPADTIVEMEVLRDATSVLTVEIRRESRSRDHGQGTVRPVGSGEFDPSMYAGSDSAGSDEAGGVGISVGRDEQGFRVTEVIRGGAADSVGIVIGDLLESIDGEFLTLDGSMTHHDIGDLLRGPPGSWVMLELRRAGEGSVQGAEQDARVWNLLNEYSVLPKP
ncbi:hypothetical protein T484DRAFT_1810757 [Baffinella frigidus]|nr:hypothetical protein T484DRAFT_1810757 [Cryptophyta sp. CCMP2293]